MLKELLLWTQSFQFDDESYALHNLKSRGVGVVAPIGLENAVSESTLVFSTSEIWEFDSQYTFIGKLEICCGNIWDFDLIPSRSNFFVWTVESLLCSRCLLTSRVVTDTSCGCRHRVLLLASCVVIGIIGNCWDGALYARIWWLKHSMQLTNQHLVSVQQSQSWVQIIYFPVWQENLRAELSPHNRNLFCFVYKSLNITSSGTHSFDSPITIHTFAEPFSPALSCTRNSSCP